jgi:hypothetical protein
MLLDTPQSLIEAEKVGIYLAETWVPGKTGSILAGAGTGGPSTNSKTGEGSKGSLASQTRGSL